MVEQGLEGKIAHTRTGGLKYSARLSCQMISVWGFLASFAKAGWSCAPSVTTELDQRITTPCALGMSIHDSRKIYASKLDRCARSAWGYSCFKENYPPLTRWYALEAS